MVTDECLSSHVINEPVEGVLVAGQGIVIVKAIDFNLIQVQLIVSVHGLGISVSGKWLTCVGY